MRGIQFSSVLRGKKGTIHEFTTLYTPQHNGDVEIRDKTMLNMAKNMLKEKKLPHKCWGEPVSTVVYILNRCLTKRLDTKTPEKAWSDKRPNVSHLRVFDSVCFRHVSAQNIRKLEDRIEHMVLLGYESTRVARPVSFKKKI